MKRLCIIPARGGSKRLPGKNIEYIAGNPLIVYTTDAITDLFDMTIVSSDSVEILRHTGCACDYNNVMCLKRPKHLATDDSKVIDTVRHYFNDMGRDYDQIWLALPTCPLRTKDDVKQAQKLLTKDIDGIVSITDYEFPPTLGLSQTDRGFIYDWFDKEPYQNDNTRSQDHPKVYRPNGALYGMWCKSFAKYRNFFTGKIKGYYMPRERSIDIDTELDLKIAEVLLSERDSNSI